MADKTHIEWTDATWNPITGCSVVSPGCTNCYAMRMAGTRLASHPSRSGLTIATKAGPVWTGDVRFNEEWLNQPIGWKRPRRIFVCAHGDLFHPSVPFGWVMRVFFVIGHCHNHTFQILTKRPDRMWEFFRLWADVHDSDLGFKGAQGAPAVRAAHPSGRGQLFADMLDAMGAPPPGCGYPFFDWAEGMARWPDVFPNVWLGVSVEDQTRAIERIPHLLRTPAAVRWISAEPLIKPVNLASFHALWNGQVVEYRPLAPGGLDWVVVGGESGPGARPMHPEWVRWIRDDCAAGVAFHFKQWGEWAPVSEIPDTGKYYDPAPEARPDAHRRCKVDHDVLQRDGRRGDLFDYPPGAMMIMKIGKRAAGRTLDGVIHDNYPEESK